MAGYCFGREHGEFGLESLPQGEHRDIVLRGGGAEGGATGNCLSRDKGESGLEKLPRGERRDTVLRGGVRAGHEGGMQLRLAGAWGMGGGGRGGARRAAAGRAPGECLRGGWGGMGLFLAGGGNGIPGLTRCRRASAGILFCME